MHCLSGNAQPNVFEERPKEFVRTSESKPSSSNSPGLEECEQLGMNNLVRGKDSWTRKKTSGGFFWGFGWSYGLIPLWIFGVCTNKGEVVGFVTVLTLVGSKDNPLNIWRENGESNSTPHAYTVKHQWFSGDQLQELFVRREWNGLESMSPGHEVLLPTYKHEQRVKGNKSLGLVWGLGTWSFGERKLYVC